MLTGAALSTVFGLGGCADLLVSACFFYIVHPSCLAFLRAEYLLDDLVFKCSRVHVPSSCIRRCMLSDSSLVHILVIPSIQHDSN